MDQSDEAPSRDARVDTVGFCNELAKFVADPLELKIKERHQLVKPVTQIRLVGDFFDGLIYGGDKRSIDAAGWLRLYENKEIKRAEFLAGITVSVEKAEKTLAAVEFNRIVSSKPKESSLKITRRKGAEARIVEVVKGMDVEMRSVLTRLGEARAA
jgi:hypothetical protein